MTRARRLALSLAPALALLAVAPGTLAQAFPTKPVKIIIGFPAGGPLDAHARLLAEKLGATLGQPVIIDYKAGAGGGVGAEFVAKSDADGHTLLMANTGTMVINPAVYRKLPYDTLKDFVLIARTAQQPLALVVNPAVPVKSVAELVSLAKSKPGQLNYGSAGNGGISHLVPEMFKQATGTFIVHIPYRGSAPAFTDLMAGQVQLMAESVPQAAQYVKAGKLRALAACTWKTARKGCRPRPGNGSAATRRTSWMAKRRSGCGRSPKRRLPQSEGAQALRRRAKKPITPRPSAISA